MRIIFFAILSGIIFLSNSASEVLASSVNPIVWRTNYAKLRSSNFYIRIGDSYFYPSNDVTVRSNPGYDQTTLEMSWNENGENMKMNLYFNHNESNEWVLYDIRVKNIDDPRDGWIYFESATDFEGYIFSLDGYRSYYASRSFVPTSKSSQVDAEIYCDDCEISAFMDVPVPIYSYLDYTLEIMRGSQNTNAPIYLSTDPSSGFGVNVLLRDKLGQPVLSQEGYTYHWVVSQNDSYVSLNSRSLRQTDGKCLLGITSSRCPEVNAQLSGLKPGTATVQVIVRLGNYDLAKNDFDVVVKDTSKVLLSSPTPFPTNINSADSPVVTPALLPSKAPVVTTKPYLGVTTTPPDSSMITQPENDSEDIQIGPYGINEELNYGDLSNEIDNLQNSVNVIRSDVELQQEELNFIQKMLQSINQVFSSIFWL